MARFPPTLVLAMVLAAAGLAAAPAGAAAKTDVVVLRSGDRITGEITELDRGRLTFKTDDMGTLAIEWDKVTSVAASGTFEVHELGAGQYFGALRPGPGAGELTVASVKGTEKVLPLARVVKIERLGATLWKRLEGSVDAGLSYASSSELLTIDLAARVELNRPGHGLGLDGSSTITRQPDAEETQRNNLTFNYRRRRPRPLGRVRPGPGRAEQGAGLRPPRVRHRRRRPLPPPGPAARHPGRPRPARQPRKAAGRREHQQPRGGAGIQLRPIPVRLPQGRCVRNGGHVRELDGLGARARGGRPAAPARDPA